MEERITAAEEHLATLRAPLSDAEIAADADKLQQAYARVEEAQGQVDTLYARWTELETKLEAGETE